MKQFLGNDFLLETETAVTLYNNYAKDMPIFDFHCHLNPEEIYKDKQFRSVTEAWLGGDHYKWRLMRELGVDERYITGDASDEERFQKYAEVIPYTIGNPLYHWTHLELKRYFGIEDILSPSTAKSIYQRANDKLKELTARQLIVKSNVKCLFTTDDPIDDLKWHELIKADASFNVRVSPAFRPDKAINIELDSYVPYIKKLSEVSAVKITDFASLTAAIGSRIDFFAQHDCVCSDHALDVVVYEKATIAELDVIIKKALSCNVLSDSEVAKYKGAVLTYLGKEYHKRNWVQQYHIGAMRNNSTRYKRLLGADTGFDAVEDSTFAKKLSQLLDALDHDGTLPKTILYCLNPRDNEVLAAIKNCFQEAGTAAKIQFGSAWWFNDQKDGMQRQMEALSQVGLLSKFVGMLTDSRSLLSYPRHEYFRRLLCNKFGNLIESGEYPCDIEFVGEIVKDICYNNSVKYFGI